MQNSMMSPVSIAPRHVNAAILLVIAMMAAILWMPATLGAIAQGYGLGAGALGRLASLEHIGFVLGTFLSSARSLRQLQSWVLGGCLLIVGANLSALLFGPQASSYWLVRLIAGVGSGIGFAYGLKVCAMSAKPTLSFGIFTASMSLVMIVGFQFIALLMESRATALGTIQPELVKGVVRLLFGAFAFLGFLAGLTNWANRFTLVEQAQRGYSAPEALVGIGLFAIGLAFAGQGGVWALLQILGVSHGFAVRSVANAMSAFAIAGIAGSLIAGVVPQRIARSAAIAVALLVLWCGLYAMYAPRSLGWYVMGCAIAGFYWNFTLPLMLGLLARIDATGQGSVLGGMMSSVGSALGPLLAGLVIRNGNYRPVGWMTGALCLLSLLCVAFVERRRR